jgi:hypothetical protein
MTGLHVYAGVLGSLGKARSVLRLERDGVESPAVRQPRNRDSESLS